MRQGHQSICRIFLHRPARCGLSTAQMVGGAGCLDRNSHEEDNRRLVRPLSPTITGALKALPIGSHRHSGSAARGDALCINRLHILCQGGDSPSAGARWVWRLPPLLVLYEPWAVACNPRCLTHQASGPRRSAPTCHHHMQYAGQRDLCTRNPPCCRTGRHSSSANKCDASGLHARGGTLPVGGVTCADEEARRAGSGVPGCGAWVHPQIRQQRTTWCGC